MLDRINDPYFIKAKKEGYRARSAYKLIEINNSFDIIPKNGKILDLGCAPGAWLQVLQKSTKANIYGIDLLKIEHIHNVNFFQKDIFSNEVEELLEEYQFDLILSDIAPNCMGIKDIDHIRIIALARRVFDIVLKFLKNNGNFCIKLFDGHNLPQYKNDLQKYFSSVKFCKPKSSHAESNELYLVCRNFIKPLEE